ncbi:MAG: hypothetical protein D3913_16625 [Candidatus Electrothrix sp. LOE1_4_5]|nr:hypothetical protein [Candidatus Electrothrix gigas]
MKNFSKLSIPVLTMLLATQAFAVEEAKPESQTKQIVDSAVKTKAKEDVSTKNIESARVISCAIKFPLDSVRFKEDQVTKCMESANLEAISYVHVIATASSSGSTSHNLYLSTRRAGAIEAFLNNRYPDIQVHAFGGGENPKFGMVARIFIVENSKKAKELSPGVQVAMAGSPEVIEKTITKYVTKTEYQDRPKEEIFFSADTGYAQTSLSDDDYQYVSVKVDKLFRTSIYMLNDFTLGIRARFLQSDYVSDINSNNHLLHFLHMCC